MSTKWKVTIGVIVAVVVVSGIGLISLGRVIWNVATPTQTVAPAILNLE